MISYCLRSKSTISSYKENNYIIKAFHINLPGIAVVSTVLNEYDNVEILFAMLR